MLNKSLKILLLFFPALVFSKEITLSFDKSKNVLSVLQESQEIKTFNFSYGKKKGKKTKLKDLKTPEGTYSIIKVHNREFMKKYFKNYKRYGSFAFVLNYPNKEDKKKGYTGSGIWIHGTDYKYRLSYPNITRGCLLLSNKDIKELHKIIEDKKVIVKIF